MTALVLLGGWSSAGWGAEWDIPSGYPDGSLPVEVLRGLAADVTRQAGGFRVKVRPVGGRMRGAEMWDAVRRGEVPAADILASTLHAVDPVFSVDSIPFLATDYGAGWRLYQAALPHLRRRLAAHGLEVLYALPWPPQGLFADRPIDSAKALRGLRFRTYNAVTLRLARLLAAEPLPIEGGDMEAALGRKQVQAMFTSAAYGADLEAWLHFSHFYDLRAWLPLNLLIVNRAAVDALGEEERAALRAAAARAEERAWQLSAVEHDGALARLAALGMTVQQPSPQLADDLRVLGGVLADEWLSRAGRDGVSVIKALAP